MGRKPTEDDAVNLAGALAYVAHRAGLKFPLSKDWFKDPGAWNGKLDNRVREKFKVDSAEKAIPAMKKLIADNDLGKAVGLSSARFKLKLLDEKAEVWQDIASWGAEALAWAAGLMGEGDNADAAAKMAEGAQSAGKAIQGADTSTQAGRDKAVRGIETAIDVALAARKPKAGEKPKSEKKDCPKGQTFIAGRGCFKTSSPQQQQQQQNTQPALPAPQDKQTVSQDKPPEETPWYREPKVYAAVGLIAALGLGGYYAAQKR